MHEYDPNGSIREYRRRRQRRESYGVILFTVGFGCALVLATCAIFIFLNSHASPQ